jgi:tetratricopeptide (TPR) repeat protein
MTSAIRNLAERRVPQVLAIYLGAAFGVVQFVDFVGSRYLLPAVWTDLTLLAMAVLLPSVLLYTYHHGRPGRDQWQRSEKIFIPCNIALLLGLVVFVGAGAPLAPTSQRITVTDEDGNQREALVPKKAYRKRVALFQFDNAGQPDATWLQFGLPWMTAQDLLQQNFIEPVPSVALREGLSKVGFDEGVNVPLALKRDVTRELHVPHFMAGKVDRAGDEYVVTVELYETETLKKLKQRVFRANNPADIADQISVALLEDLAVPVITDSKPDMPVAELLSSNQAALRAYVEGTTAYQNRNDFASAVKLLDQATRQDPTFAFAFLQRYAVALLSNDHAAAMPALEAAMKHSYRLPERLRELLKSDHYVLKQDYARAFAVLDMLAQLYPDDVQIQQNLMQINAARDNKDAVIATGRRILSLDPTRSELMLTIGQIYEEKGDYRAALREYESYAAKFPRDPRALRRVGSLQRTMGAHAAARAAYEKALLVDPQDVQTLVGLAELQRNIGDFAAAQATHEQALSAAANPETRDQALRGLAGLYEFRGQIRKAIETREAARDETRKYAPPASVLMIGLNLPGQWARIDAAAAERELEKLRKSLTPPWSLNLPIAELMVYVETGDATRAEASVQAMEALAQQGGLKVLSVMIAYGKGRVAEQRGDCNTALQLYRQSAAQDPSDRSIYTHIGRCLRKLGKHDEARTELNKLLVAVPAHGNANLEMGLLFVARGEATQARTYLQKALQTWPEADEKFRPAREARDALASL